MNFISILIVIVVYSIAFLTAYLLRLKFYNTGYSHRYETIDALRGFLALGVFIHHTWVWYHYLHTGQWVRPTSNLFSQLGGTSVSLFFMITAFLFVSKLVNAPIEGFRWLAFFVSRFFRLFPMYFLVVVVLVVIVMSLSKWQIHGDWINWLKSIFQWFAFTIFEWPDINQCKYTSIIVAGVVWSLPYEWLFYFSLPWVALFILQQKPRLVYLFISALFVVMYVSINTINLHHLMSFAGGAIAPFIIQYNKQKRNFDTTKYTLLLLVSLVIILCFNTSDNVVCKLLIILVFNLIALGNTVFGLLNHSTLKLMGETAYSTYLLHGILLFTVLYFGFGLERAATLSYVQYNLVVLAITPLLVLLSFFGYRYVEKPFMDWAKMRMK